MRARDMGLIALCGLITYFSSLFNPFLFDDSYAVEGNPLLTSMEGLVHVLTQKGLTGGPVLSSHYRPLSMSSLWLDYQIYGAEPQGYRLTNLILHIFCAVLVGVFAIRLTVRFSPDSTAEYRRRIAQIAGLLFCVHPIYSEAILQIYKRTSSLATICMLASILCVDHALAEASSAAARRISLAAAIGLAGCGMLAKESAVIMPALIALYLLAIFGRAIALRRVIGISAAFAAIPAAFVLIVRPAPSIETSMQTSLRHLLAQPEAFAHYAGMFVFPSRVPIAMGIQPSAWPPPLAAVFGCATLLVLVLVAVLGFRRMPRMSFAILFGAVCVLPTSSFVPMYVVADPIHIYMATVPLVIFVAQALASLQQRIAVHIPESIARTRNLLASLPATCLIVLTAFGTLAVGERNADRATAWRHAANLYPQAALIVANACIAEPILTRAIRTCRRAEELDPADPFVVARRIALFQSSGRIDDAEKLLAASKAREFSSPRWPIDFEEGIVALRRGQPERAHDAFLRALSINPSNLKARVHLADLRLRLKLPGAKALVTNLPEPTDAKTSELLQSVRRRLSLNAGHTPLGGI